MVAVGPQEVWQQVAEIVRLIRKRHAQTRPELVERTRLGRNVVAHRLQTARELGLVEPDGTGRSRGGRAAERWRFRSQSGCLLVGTIGVRSLRVALTDLGGNLAEARSLDWTIATSPESTCERLAQEMRALLERHGQGRPWGVVVGMPAPVDPSTGRIVDPITASEDAPRWQPSLDVRSWFSERFGVPAWTESVANLSALGAATAPGAPSDLVFVRVGTGIGCGIVTNGRIHRGVRSLAGQISHVTVREDPDRPCHCGRTGCLDTYSGGWAMVADARRAVREGRSEYLAAIAVQREIVVEDIAVGGHRGDQASVEIMVRSSDMLGRVLGPMITWFNPGEVIVSGPSLVHDPVYQTVLDRSIRATALGASAEATALRTGDPDESEVVVGGAVFALDALLSAAYLTEWGPSGSPLDVRGLIGRERQA